MRAIFLSRNTLFLRLLSRCPLVGPLPVFTWTSKYYLRTNLLEPFPQSVDFNSPTTYDWDENLDMPY